MILPTIQLSPCVGHLTPPWPPYLQLKSEEIVLNFPYGLFQLENSMMVTGGDLTLGAGHTDLVHIETALEPYVLMLTNATPTNLTKRTIKYRKFYGISVSSFQR